MRQKKNRKILLYFFLFLLLGTTHNLYLKKLELPKIEKIEIIGLNKKENNEISKDLNSLYLQSLFFLNNIKIEKILSSHSIIESFSIFRKFPSTLKIDVKKTKILANRFIDGQNFLIGSNGKLIPTVKPYKDLPFIFGNPKIDEFLKFKQIIDNSKFSYNQIENLYFYQSKRWDLKLKENILLKLPNDFSNKILDTLYEFLEEYNVKNFTIIDSRIKNQIILNE